MRSAILAQNPDFDFGAFARDQAEKKARQLISPRTEQARETAAARVQGTAGENIKLVMQSASEVIPQAAQAAQAVPATAFPRLNRLMQTAASEIGDPALRRFQLANLELAEMLARALNPRSSVVAVRNMDRAVELISTADSPEAYRAVLTQIKQFVERQYRAVQREQAGQDIPNIEIPTGPRQLQPTDRQILPKGAGLPKGWFLEPLSGDMPVPTPP
jgi:hypothetical protein